MKQTFDVVTGAGDGYHHGHLPEALHAAARDLLEKGDDVGLRELARRIGVSPTAVYRHFESKDDLLASVAAEGFHQLAAEIESAATEPGDSRLAAGLAYVDFALDNPGLFGLMFGRHLAQRKEFPALQRAADETFAAFERFGLTDREPRRQKGDNRFGPWCYLHGLAQLSTTKLASREAVRRLARAFLGTGEPNGSTAAIQG